MIWHDLANKCDGKFDDVFLNPLEEEPNLSPLEEFEQRENRDQVSLNNNNSTPDENVNHETSLESETESKQEDNAPSLPSTPSTTRSVPKSNQSIPDNIANYKSAHVSKWAANQKTLAKLQQNAENLNAGEDSGFEKLLFFMLDAENKQEDHQAEQESQLQDRILEEKHERAEREERKHDHQFQLMLLMALAGKNPGMENSEN
ncbi:hypothetical protein HK096_005632 [Nowakowskiella sp. JEL0078]|nr:hypothetical protein HK096_005632 [Nowakowskiella sp. JEL0078]